jgi:energy-coupling factor transporter ATP-binding protein EcfA2
MIASIEIENLRGIRAGRLEDLAPLTVLTGPNACGKSTILDALLIAASPDPADAVGRAVRRHPAVSGGARWLFFREQRKAEVTVAPDPASLAAMASGIGGTRRLGWFDRCDEDLQEQLIRRRSPPPYSMIHVEEMAYPWTGDAVPTSAWTALGGDNQYETKRDGEGASSETPFVRLVDPGLAIPLHLTFTEVKRAGRLEAVHELLADLLPGFDRLEIVALTEQDFGLAVSRNGSSVPVALSGDGIQAFTQVALEVALAPGGLALVEEPEVYQHPKAIRQTARVLVANVRRGVQTVLTTHSLELIDSLLAEADEQGLEGMALFNLALEDGELRSGRRAGEEISFARVTLENDLR